MNLRQKLDNTLIRNILTVRYNPEEKPPLNKISHKILQKSLPSNEKVTQKLLVESINNICKNDEKIAVSLSGGIDSSLVLGLLRKTFPNKKIFGICGIFEDAFNESNYAKQNCEQFDAELKTIPMGSIFQNMPEIISITKKPKWNTYQHLIAKYAAKYAKILLTGDGADEIFAGYVFRYSKFLNLLHKSDNWKQKTVNYLECHNRDWVPDQKNLFNPKFKFSWIQILKYFKPYFSNTLHPLEQVFLADFNGKLLFDFIPSGNLIGKHYDLEIKSIFLNDNIIKHGLNLSLTSKYDHKNQLGKIPLRKLCKINNIVHLPNKKGFSPSLLFDWNKHGKEICQQHILSQKAEIYKKKLINFDWVMSSIDKIDTDGDIRYINRIISVLALEIWLKIFITREINSKTKL